MKRKLELSQAMKAKLTSKSGNTTPKYSSDNDDGYDELDDEQHQKSFPGKDRNQRHPVPQPNSKPAARTRPTNNQLLYKAYFRWQHYPWKIRNGSAGLPTETDACPSVSAAFLQVLQHLSKAEINRAGPRRNILQILSTNTRRTKVVELSSGTHRVPDELKRHYLADGENGKYHTNLDRNRYGNDDQYLFTVIRYDLEFLNLCPCLVDVEIIDAKDNNQSISVSAGPEACICANKCKGSPLNGVMHQHAGAKHSDSPKKSRSISGGGSQMFDALVMVAHEESKERNQPEGYPGEPPVSSNPNAAAGAARGPPVKRHSRLWSMGMGNSNQDDSLQNALEAFKKMDMPLSPSFSLLNSTKAEEEIASDPAQLLETNNEVSFRKRSRKPLLRNSSSALNLDSSLMSGPMPDSGLREKSGENGSRQEPQEEGGGDGPAPTSISNGDDSEDPAVVKPHGGQGLLPHQQGEDAEDMDDAQPPNKQRRVRYVVRQSSAFNLGTRMAPAELKRLTAEVDFWRQENKQLHVEVEAQQAKFRDLEAKLDAVQQEMHAQIATLVHAKKAAEEKASSSFALNSMLAKLLMQNANGSAALAALMTSAGTSMNGMAAGMDSLAWAGMAQMQPPQANGFHAMMPADMLPNASLQQQMQAGHLAAAVQQQQQQQPGGALFSGIPSWAGDNSLATSGALPAAMLGQAANGFAGMLALQQQQLAGMAAAQLAAQASAANPLLSAVKKAGDEMEVAKPQPASEGMSQLDLGQVPATMQLPDFPALHTGIAQLAK